VDKAHFLRRTTLVPVAKRLTASYNAILAPISWASAGWFSCAPEPGPGAPLAPRRRTALLGVGGCERVERLRVLSAGELERRTANATASAPSRMAASGEVASAQAMRRSAFASLVAVRDPRANATGPPPFALAIERIAQADVGLRVFRVEINRAAPFADSALRVPPPAQYQTQVVVRGRIPASDASAWRS